MWKLSDEAEGAGREENAAKIKAKLEALIDKIPEIKSLEVGVNVLPSDMAYDAALVSTFESLEALNTYKNHPEHVVVSQFVKKVRTGRHVVDFEVAH